MLKPKEKFVFINRLTLFKNPITDKIQDFDTKLIYIRKTYDLNSLTPESKSIFFSRLQGLSKSQIPYIKSLLSVKIEGDQLTYIRDYQHFSLKEYLKKNEKTLVSKQKRKFLKSLFFALIESVYFLKFLDIDLKIGHSPPPFNIKAENILLDEKGNIFITDHIDPFNHETMNLHNEDLLNIGKIMLFVAIYDGNNLDFHKNINYRLLLHNHRDNFPKGIYEIIYIALESDPALQIDINELYSKAAFIKKKQKYKETSKDKETLENEAFMLRKATLYQNKDINIIIERLNEKGIILENARDYFLNIEKTLFEKTINENKLVVQCRILESELREARISHRNQQTIYEDKLKATTHKLKETREQSIQQKLRLYVENIENQGFSETITLSKHQQKVFSCIFYQDPDDFHLKICSGSLDGSLIFWDLFDLQSKTVEILNAHQASINALAYSNKTGYMYSGSDDKHVKVWDLQKKKSVQTICGSKGSIQAIKPIKPDIMAISGSDTRIYLYNETKGKFSNILKGHDQTVWSLTSLYDETCIVSVSSDKTVKIWDLETQKCILTMKGHEKDVISLEELTEKKLLATGGIDQTIRFWDPVSGDCVQLIYEGEKEIKYLKKIDKYSLASLNSFGVNIYDIKTFKKLEVVRGDSDSGNSYGGLGYFEEIGCLGYGFENDIKLFV